MLIIFVVYIIKGKVNLISVIILIRFGENLIVEDPDHSFSYPKNLAGAFHLSQNLKIVLIFLVI